MINLSAILKKWSGEPGKVGEFNSDKPVATLILADQTLVTFLVSFVKNYSL